MRMAFDSSSLILLAKIQLLRDVAEDIEIVIPQAVKKECLVKETLDAKLISLLIKEERIKVQKVIDIGALKKLQRDFRIGQGEAEALLLARINDLPIAVDDGPTIKVCKVMGQRFLTALHFLLSFASKDKIDARIANEKLDALARYGRYSKRIIEDAVRRLEGGK